MHRTDLPSDCRGEWIWRSDGQGKLEQYLFFRREFMITEVPSIAELWISAHTRYQLYINGRPFSRGQSSAPKGRTYASYFDITHCMEIGLNVIAVCVHNTCVSRSAFCRKEDGFWCQMNLEQTPTLWTDGEWYARLADCYLDGQPRVSQADAFVETLDFRRYPHGWMELRFDAEDWPLADVQTPFNKIKETVEVAPDFEPVPEYLALDFLERRGKVKQRGATAHVALSHYAGKTPGLYAAETHMQAKGEGSVDFQVYCDDPYYLFINDRLMARQGRSGDPMEWMDAEWNPPRCHMQDEQNETNAGKFTLVKDEWVRILVIQQVAPGSAGLTLIFPELDHHGTRFTRGTDAFSLPGWNVTGPLKVPFANVVGPISMDELKTGTYHGIMPEDAAAHFNVFAFEEIEQHERTEEYDPVTSLELAEGEYAVFSLKQYARGCLNAKFSGAAGDTIDIIFGDHLIDGRVRPHLGDRRKIYTVILHGNRVDEWGAFSPSGMKYVMILVRHASENVKLDDLTLRQMKFSFREPGNFTCADELLNRIWETSLRTWDATYDYTFLNSSSRNDGQLLGDAFIQSTSSLFTVGSYDLSEKALREFAGAQFETGEIPAIAPSDLAVRLWDFSLLWPIWLQKHIHYTDDRQLAEDLLPRLEQMLNFFETIATTEDVLLANLTPPYLLPCLIDYDAGIDSRGVPTALNALYCLALLKSEWLFLYLGKMPEAQICHQRAARIAEILRELTWDPDQGLFADCWVDGARSEKHSLQTNVIALYAGLVGGEDQQRLFNAMFIDYAPFVQLPVDHESENAFFKFFLVDTAYAINSRDWATDFMRYYWGKMIQKGADCWWERFSPNIDFQMEMTPCTCHGHGVSPTYFIIREIVGIRPVQAGFLQVYFNPLLTAVEWARARIPTPQGVIMVDWAFNPDGDLEIVIESNYPMEVVPQLDEQVAENAIFHVNDTVTILKISEAEE